MIASTRIDTRILYPATSIASSLWYSNVVVAFPEIRSNDFSVCVRGKPAVFPHSASSCSEAVHCLFTPAMSRSDLLSKLYASLLDARNKARNNEKYTSTNDRPRSYRATSERKNAVAPDVCVLFTNRIETEKEEVISRSTNARPSQLNTAWNQLEVTYTSYEQMRPSVVTCRRPRTLNPAKDRRPF